MYSFTYSQHHRFVRVRLAVLWLYVVSTFHSRSVVVVGVVGVVDFFCCCLLFVVCCLVLFGVCWLLLFVSSCCLLL